MTQKAYLIIRVYDLWRSSHSGLIIFFDGLVKGS